jgi:uncharacterized repeat protein (TIGR04052 family)
MNRYILKKILSVTTIFGLSITLLSGCFQKSQPTKISFQAVYKNTDINCASSFSDVHELKSSESQKWQYQQLQFFIHGVEVNTSSNGWQPWLMTTNANQADNVALLGEICDRKNGKGYWQLELMPLDEAAVVTDIRFTLGVPFALNHLNPLTQPSPLNDASMFWGWQGGHKFMRAELVSQNDDWLFHLGSTGCKALSPVRAPKNECFYPNRVSVALPFTLENSTIEFDLALLVRDVGLASKNSCQSAIDEESCKMLFKNLGLGVNTSNESLLFKTKNNG